MKGILPLLLLGLIGCGGAPIAKNTNGASPSGAIVAPAPVAPVPSAATAVPNASTSPNPPIAQPAEVPAAVAPAKPTTEPTVALDEPVIDPPEQRTARIEMARQMENTTVLRNQNWTIKVGGDWSGVNGEGNLTYEGCDTKGQCLNLKGGVVSCRDGVCSQGWQNGDYRYSLSAPIAEVGEAQSSSTLRVFQGDRLILEETGLQPVR